MIQFNWYSFDELSCKQLYALLALRAQVFVVEQECPYLDPDGKDFYALHLLGMVDENLSACIRLFPPTDNNKEIVFGRVVTAPHLRTKGYGKKLMQELLNYCDTNFPNIAITCSAQFYLKKFYESFGFVAQGEIYDEDGIPHIAMRRHMN